MIISVMYKIKGCRNLFSTWYNSVDDMLHHLYFSNCSRIRIDYHKGDFYDIPWDYLFELYYRDPKNFFHVNN